MSSLPYDIMHYINGFLGPVDILRLLLTCKGWWQAKLEFPNFQNAKTGTKFFNFDATYKISSILKVKKVLPFSFKRQYSSVMSCMTPFKNLKFDKGEAYRCCAILLPEKILLISGSNLKELSKLFDAKIETSVSFIITCNKTTGQVYALSHYGPFTCTLEEFLKF